MATTDLRDMSDAGLVVGIARYRQEALAEVYRRHAGAVYALARRVTNESGLGRRSRARGLVAALVAA